MRLTWQSYCYMGCYEWTKDTVQLCWWKTAHYHGLKDQSLSGKNIKSTACSLTQTCINLFKLTQLTILEKKKMPTHSRYYSIL